MGREHTKNLCNDRIPFRCERNAHCDSIKQVHDLIDLGKVMGSPIVHESARQI